MRIEDYNLKFRLTTLDTILFTILTAFQIYWTYFKYEMPFKEIGPMVPIFGINTGIIIIIGDIAVLNISRIGKNLNKRAEKKGRKKESAVIMDILESAKREGKTVEHVTEEYQKRVEKSSKK